jgi:large subunit ribosomal protein L15
LKRRNDEVKLSELTPARGAVKKRKRVGCGPGSGHGKRSCRGNKGQRARNSVNIWFEGGQMPLQRRLPKRGFTNPTRVEYQVVNVGRLAGKYTAGEDVTPETLRVRDLVKSRALRVKILGTGEIGIPLKIAVHAISAKAKEIVEKAGGTVSLIK